MTAFREERIGGCRLIQGDCLEVMPTLGEVDHIISDPPYESIMHEAKKATSRRLRTDGGREFQPLDFSSIDSIRPQFIAACSISLGWVIVTTGEIGGEARRYANKIMADSNLAIVMLDGGDLSAISDSPAAIIRSFEREARHAMNLKKLEH